MFRWSPLLRYDISEKYTLKSNELPLPTGKTINSEGNDSEMNIKLSELLLINKYRDVLIDLMNNRESFNFIYSFVDILLEIKKYQDKGYTITFNGDDEFESLIALIINKHNKYLNNCQEDKLEDILQNFISKRIWLISINPINWIQGQKSVDEVTGPWKNIADQQLLAKNADRFINKSIYSHFELLILTISGKENVGISANSLKVFEAISHGWYNLLLNGSPEDIKNLFFDLEIKGQKLRAIANAWCNSERMEYIRTLVSEELYDILVSMLNSSDDAFTELSAFLSLAADNAKDPTLAKINGTPNIVGLYTSGIMLLLNRNDLVNIINSKTGVLFNELMQSDMYHGTSGFDRLRNVIEYIKTGPLDDKSFIKSLVQQVLGDKYKVSRSSYFGSLYNETGVILGKKILSILNKIKNAGKTNSVNLDDIVLSSYEENLIIKNEDSEYSLSLKMVQEILNSLKNKINNIREKILNGNEYRINNEINELFRYYDALDIVTSDTYRTISLKTGGLYDRMYFNDLEKLTLVNEECLMMSTFTSLNLGYRTNLEEFVASVSKMQSLLIDAYKYSSKKDDSANSLLSIIDTINDELFDIPENQRRNSNKIVPYLSLRGFISDLLIDITDYIGNISNVDELIGLKNINGRYFITYRDLVSNFYDKIKTFINPFTLILHVEHYFGYLEGMYVAHESCKNISHIYNVIDLYLYLICSDLNIYKKEELSLVVKKLINYLLRIRNQYFFDGLNYEFECPASFKNSVNDSGETIKINLRTEENRALFKRFVEVKLLPILKELFSDNQFIQSLYIEDNNQTPSHNIQALIVTNVNTRPNTTEELNKYRAVKEDLAKLKQSSARILGVKPLEYLFLYNLIATDNILTQGSYAILFEDIIRDKDVPIINQYLNHILNFRGFNFEQDDRRETLLAAEKYCAPYITDFSHPVSYNYIYARNTSNGKVSLYKLTGISTDSDFDEEQRSRGPIDRLSKNPNKFYQIISTSLRTPLDYDYEYKDRNQKSQRLNIVTLLNSGTLTTYSFDGYQLNILFNNDAILNVGISRGGAMINIDPSWNLQYQRNSGNNKKGDIKMKEFIELLKETGCIKSSASGLSIDLSELKTLIDNLLKNKPSC